MQKKEKLIDGVSAIPLIGSILSPIVGAVLKSPIVISALLGSGYIAKDYASQDGLTFVQSVVEDKKYLQVSSCVLSEKGTSPEKIIPCVEKKISPTQNSNDLVNENGKNDLGLVVDAISSASKLKQNQD